jgi:pyruvate/2-oxoglutarate dehydrogenase complex dihydrolipoamide acyltransferase (E2) component
MSELVDVVVPNGIDTDDDEIVLATWLFEDGETVAADTEICQLMVSKASFDIVAPVTGRLRHVAQVESTVTIGQVIARIETA